MKHTKILIAILGIYLFLGFTSCAEDKRIFGDNFEIPELTDENTIQFTVDATGDWKQLELIGGGGRMAIEWGDGRLQKVENAGDDIITYTYGNRRTYHVRIWAEELYFFNFGGLLVPVSNLRLGYLPKMRTLTLNNVMNTVSLDLSSSCPNLETVSVGSFTDLERLDIAHCRKLKDVQVYTLPNLRQLNFGDHPDLKGVWCEASRLVSLSLKGFPSLEYVFCNNNPLLSELEFDDGVEIKALRIRGCAFKALDFLHKLSLLSELECSHNQLTELDISKQSLLYSLDCSNNKSLTDLLLPEENRLLSVECHNCHLDGDALNSVFGKLLQVPESYPGYENSFFISYYDNPGETGCDKGLLKGWLIGMKADK